MNRVVLVTDSSACLPAELAMSYGVTVLPISAEPSTTNRAGQDETAAWELPADIEAEQLAGANHPFVTEYLEAVEAAHYDAAVIVTPAIEFATMYRNAALAGELANRPTAIIDARTAAAGQALVVLAGARSAAAGGDLAEVVRVVEDASRRVELVASLATLEPLRRSGPVPEDVLRQAELAGTRSMFRMRDGIVEPLGSTPTAEQSLETIRSAFLQSTAAGVESSTVFHAEAPELAARLESLLGGVDFVSGFSVAMQVHTGLGVVGAAWLPKMPS